MMNIYSGFQLRERGTSVPLVAWHGQVGRATGSFICKPLYVLNSSFIILHSSFQAHQRRLAFGHFLGKLIRLIGVGALEDTALAHIRPNAQAFLIPRLGLTPALDSITDRRARLRR
jgi:hypothetical protein